MNPKDRALVASDYRAAARNAALERRFDACNQYLMLASLYHDPPSSVGPVDEIEVDVDFS